MRVASRVATALLAVFAGLALAHPPYAPVTPDTPLTAKQAQRDLRVLERALTELHPGLYRYQSPDAVQAQFASAREQVADGSTRGEMALIASRIAAAVRCGHTRSGPYNHREDIAGMFAALPALPLEVRWFGDRMLVTESADASVPRHAELLAIDGRTPGELVAALMPYLRADGGNDAKRRDQLNSGPDGGVLDRLLPLLFPPADGHYALRLRVDGRTRDVRVRAITPAARDEALKAAGVAAPSQAWSMRIEGDVAVMTLPTFAFWNNPFPWQATLDGWFAELRAKGIRRLVIDLRANEGGDAAIGQALLAQLIRAPYTTPAARVESAYERAPYDLMRFLDTWDYSFFDRTGKVDRGDGRAYVLPGVAPVTVQPVAQPFEGKVVALVGPRMSSGGFLVARDLQASRAATLVGRGTGGNLRGLNAGQITWVVLPESGVSVDIPLLATFYDGQPPDQGVRPDIAVANTLEDVVAGRDREFARALRAVR